MSQDKKLFILVQFPDIDFHREIRTAFDCVVPVMQEYPVNDPVPIKQAIVEIASAISKLRSKHFNMAYGSEVSDPTEYIKKKLKVTFEEKILKDELYWDVTVWYDPYTKLIV
jgi:hypothetical protein